MSPGSANVRLWQIYYGHRTLVDLVGAIGGAAAGGGLGQHIWPTELAHRLQLVGQRLKQAWCSNSIWFTNIFYSPMMIEMQRAMLLWTTQTSLLHCIDTELRTLLGHDLAPIGSIRTSKMINYTSCRANKLYTVELWLIEI